MTIADVKAGGWASHEILTSAQMNSIRAELLKCIDGSGGGTYTLTAPLIIGGDTVRIDSQLAIEASATLFSDGDVEINGHLEQDGTADFDGTTTVNGALNVNNNATFNAVITANDSANFNDTVSMSSQVNLVGSLVEMGNSTELQFQFAENATVDAAPYTMRLPMIALPNGGLANFLYEPLISNGYLATSAGGPELLFPLPANEGDVIDHVRLQVVGGFGSGHGGTDPPTKMRCRLYESLLNGDGPYAVVASLTDPATGAGYDARHQIDLNPAYTALNRQYLVGFRAESGGGTAAANENMLEAIFIDIIKNKLVSVNTYMSG